LLNSRRAEEASIDATPAGRPPGAARHLNLKLRTRPSDLAHGPSGATAAAARAAPLADRPSRSLLFAAAIASGVDVATLALASAARLDLERAGAASFAAALVAFVLALRRTGRSGGIRSPGALVVVALLAFALHAGVLSLLAQHGLPPWIAGVPAALAAATVAVLGTDFVHGQATTATDDRTAWARAAILVIVYLLVLRLVYLGQLELAPQESYYWNFAKHLDLGYLDHPPLVAWLIAASTVAGDTEWLVRLPAVLCSLATIGFVWLYTRELGGTSLAWRAALLAAVLPYFFGIGVVITPDTPLATAWAAALWCLARALLRDDDRAWIGAGIAIGLGMLSKYTMVLVPLAVLAFVVLDRRLGRTLLSPWPWIGALLAVLVFSPVIVWNLQHAWASFAFQGSRRLDPEAKRFGLHLFVLFLFLVVTPWGIAGLVRGARGEHRAQVVGGGDGAGTPRLDARALRFALVFTVVPLLPLAVTSLWTETKLHWTGPIWLAALPVMATTLAMPSSARASRFDRALAASWPHVVHVLLAVYALALFYYPVYGLAGIRAHHRYIETGWRDLRMQVQAIEDEVTAQTGARPAVVGLDKHNIADQMAFYDPRGDGPIDTASRNIVTDADALMYGLWFSPHDFAGRNLVVVACDRGAVEGPGLARQAERIGAVRALQVRKGGVHTRDCYARVLYGFRPEASSGRQGRP
jgi:dolichol-phosphate mannosyltransferase